MTQMAHRICSDAWGCIISGHTDRDCYWRYLDNTLDIPEWLDFTVLSYKRWTEENYHL